MTINFELLFQQIQSKIALKFYCRTFTCNRLKIINIGNVFGWASNGSCFHNVRHCSIYPNQIKFIFRTNLAQKYIIKEMKGYAARNMINACFSYLPLSTFSRGFCCKPALPTLFNKLDICETDITFVSEDAVVV